MNKNYILLFALFTFFLLVNTSAFSADRYWVGGGLTEDWDAVGDTNWSDAPNGANNFSVPTSSDNVFFTSFSGNATLSANITIRSLNCTGYTGTLTHNAAVTLSIGDNYPGAGIIALKLVAGMTYTLGSATTSAITFTAAMSGNFSTISHSVDFGGKITGDVTYNGSGGTWRLLSSHNTGSTAKVTLLLGTLVTNDQSVSWGVFNSNIAGSRTLSLGASSVTLTGTGTVWNVISSIGLSSNTSTITISDASAVAKTFAGGGETTYNNITFSGDNITVTGNNTFLGTFRVQNAALPTGLLLTSTSTQTVGEFTTNGSAGNLAILKAVTGASAAIITKASGIVSVDYMSLQDITAATAGTAVWYAGANTTNVSGNSGWIFTASIVRYWVGGGSSTNWDAVGPTNWSTTSGGANNASVPIPGDNLFFDSNSGIGNSVISANVTIRSFDCSGYKGTITHNAAVKLSIGDGTAWSTNIGLKFTSGMTYTLGDPISSEIEFISTTATVQTIDFAQKITGNVTFNGIAGSWKLLGGHQTGIAATVTLTNGTLNTNGQSVSWGLFNSNNANTRTLTLSSSIITLKGVGNIWDFTDITNLTFNSNTSTLVISNITATAKTFIGGGQTFNHITFSGDNITVTGSNTFNQFRIENAGLTTGLLLTSTTTQTISGFSTNGSAGNLSILKSTVGASAATITKVSGRVSVDFMSIQDITAATTGTAVWFAGTNSNDVSGNGGGVPWSFTKPGARYWVGGNASSNWDAVGNTNWSTTSGGANNASAPGATDDVFFDANSGSGISTINTAYSIRSLNTTGFTGTLIHNDFTLTIGGSNGLTGIENVALKFESGMTYTLSSSASAITFSGTSTTTQSVDFAGKSTGNITYNAVGASWKLAGTHVASDATITLTNGELNTNNQSCTWGQFNSDNGNIRTLNLGSSSISLLGISSNNYWDSTNVTGLTMTPNSAIVTINKKINISIPTFDCGAKDLNGLSLVYSGGGQAYITWAAAGGVLKNLTYNGALNSQDPTLEDVFTLRTDLADFTVTNSLNINGYSGGKRTLFSSFGTHFRSIILTGASVNCSNVDFLNINFISAVAAELPFNLSGITGGAGDLSGNIGMTLTTGVNLFWYTTTNGTKLWSDSANWFLGTGGSGGNANRRPLPQDNAIFDANSIGAVGTKIESDFSRLCTDITWTGVTNSPEWHFPITAQVFGSITLGAGMTMTAEYGVSLYLSALALDKTINITSAGVVFNHNAIFFNLNLLNQIARYTTNSLYFLDDFNGNSTDTTGIYIAGRAFLNDKNITVGQFKVGEINGDLLIMGSSTLKITGADYTNPNGNFTLCCMPARGIIAETSTLEFSNATSLPKSLYHNGNGLNNFVISGAGNAIYSFRSGGTINNFTDNKTDPHTLKFFGGQTFTFNGTIDIKGSSGNLVTLTSTSTTPFIWSKSSGSVNCEYMIISKSTVQGGAVYNAASPTAGSSVDGGNNTGWLGLTTDNFTWTRGNNNDNWNDVLNWQGGAIPTINDIAYFTGIATGNCNINIDPNCKGINIGVGYVGTITQASAMTIGTSGFEMNGGTFAGATQNITIAGLFSHIGGTFTSTSGTIEVTAQGLLTDTWREKGGTFNHNNGTIKVNGTLDAVVTSRFRNESASVVTVKFNHLDINTTGVVSGRIILDGNLTRTQGTTLNADISFKGDYLGSGVGGGSAGSGTIRFIGTAADQSFTYPYAPNVQNNITGFSLLVPANITVGGSWTQSAGNITWNNNKVTFDSTSAGDITISSGSFYDVEFAKNNTDDITISNTCTIANDLTITSLAELNGSESAFPNSYVDLGGNFVTNDTSWSGTSRIVFSGASDKTFTGIGTLGIGAEINKLGGSIELFSNFDMPNTGHDLKVISGNLVLSGFNLTISDSLTVFGTLSLKGSEIITVNGTSSNLSTNANFTLSATSSTVIYTDTNLAVVSNLSKTFYNLIFGASKTHEFATGAPNLTTVNGYLSSNGTAGTRSILRSVANAAVDWKLTLVGTSTLADKVNVRRSDASGGLGVLAVGSQDGGNNTNWVLLIPCFASSSMGPLNAYIDVTCTGPVYATNTTSGALDAADFQLVFAQNAGNATNVTLASVTNTSGGATVGGETTLRLNLTITGTPSGVETITVSAVAASIFDAFGTAYLASSSTGAVNLLSLTPPTVLGVTSTTGNGTYILGSVIAIQVTFDTNVTVTGTPVLNLETGTVDRAVNYSSGSGTTILTFTYTVQAGDVSADLNYLSTAALTGTIKNVATVSATLTLPGLAAAGALAINQDMIVDGVVPTIQSQTLGALNAYIDITFDGPVYANNNGTGGLAAADFGLTFAANGGTATNTTIASVTTTAAGATAGGETTLRLNLTITGVVAGTETITIVPVVNSIFDLAGNPAPITTTTGAVTLISAAGPDVTGVSSSTANGSYKLGDIIAIQVTFSALVNVTGTPTLTLETGTTDRVVNYSSGSGSTILVFNYTVQSGDTSLDLDYTAITSLALNGGTIKNASATNATLTLATPGLSNSLGANKEIKIDTTVPTISSVSASTADGNYNAGDAILITVVFSEAVIVTGAPTITLETGDTDRTAIYASGSGTTTLVFSYTVQSGDMATDLDYTATTALALASGTITDAALNAATLTLATPGAANSLGANKAIIIDTTIPVVLSVSSSTADGIYKVGAVISITVTFSKVVNVAGVPTLTLETGTTDRTASYASGSNSTVLVFNYTVQSGDSSSDLDYVDTSSLSLASGSINDEFLNAATLTLAAPGLANSLGGSKAIVIDTIAPTFASQALDAGFTFIDITFNEPIYTTSGASGGLASADFSLIFAKNGGTATGVTISSVTTTSGSATTGGETTVRLNLTVSGIIAGVEKFSIAPVSNSIFDMAGNAAPTSTSTGTLLIEDEVGPTITNVTSSTADGNYKAGDVISIQVVFSESVTVTGTPVLSLETGSTDQSVNYVSGSGSTTLTFTYVVQSGDTSADLEVQSTTALSLNGGTILDVANNVATLTLPTLGATGSLGLNKALVIDTTVPTILSAVLSPSNDFVTITFSEAVYTTAGTGAIAPSDFGIDFAANGGSATGVSITSILTTTNSALVGGETTIKIFISVSGTPSGQETVTVKALASSIFDLVGNALVAREISGTLTKEGGIDTGTSSGGGGGCQYSVNAGHENGVEWLLLLLVLYLPILTRKRR